MNKNSSLTISLIIITGLIVFGGSFLVAMYFMEPNVSQNTENQVDKSHLGYCNNERIYRSFETALENPEDVCTIQIDDGTLTEIPAEVSQLKNLRYLSIIRNDVTTIPPQIGELDNLLTLYLNFNDISNVPEEISGLDSLQRLQLVGNSISASDKSQIREWLPGVDIAF